MKLNLRSALVQVLIFVFTGIACTSQTQTDSNNESKLTVKEVIDKHSAELLSIDGVEGLYESLDDNDNPVIKIMVASDDPGLLKRLPDNLEGYNVLVVVSGKIKPL
jgi:hypothetical protein